MQVRLATHLAFLATSACLAHAVLAADAPSRIVIRDVTVISPERAAPLEHAYVRLENGRIAEVGTRQLKGGLEIDGKGRYLIPGLIDTHTHPGWVAGLTQAQAKSHLALVNAAQAQEPRSYLYFGFTTVLALGENATGVTNWNAFPVHPDAYFCGKTPVVNGYGFSGFPESSYFLFKPQQAAQIPASIDKSMHTPQSVVTRMVADGAICVKTYFERGFGATPNLPTPDLEMVQELVAAAHANGLPVFMHANSREAQQFALDAGVDVMAHGLWNGPDLAPNGALAADVQAIVLAILKRGVGYQATTQVLRGLIVQSDSGYFAEPLLPDAYPASLLAWYQTDEAGWFRKDLADVPPRVFEYKLRLGDTVLRTLAASNARLLFGTDTPSDDTYGNPPGLNGFYEMRRWIAAGVTREQLFRAATLENAKVMRLQKEIGTVEAGKRANLLLLKANPLRDVEAYNAIEIVFLGGRPIERGQLSARHGAAR